MERRTASWSKGSGWLAAVALAGCGHVERATPGVDAAGAGAASFAGADSTASPPTTAGASGEAGLPHLPKPPAVDISGRWGMFTFDDPVGVQLFQDGAQLTGKGCASGTPPVSEPPSPDLCGAIAGTVEASFARFAFSFLINRSVTYSADVTVSADGQRMAGTFRALNGLPRPTAWLRVPDGKGGLDSSAAVWDEPLIGSYTLRLKEASDGGTEYSGSRPYLLRYTGQGIVSDLGSFWLTELRRRSAMGPVDVGPVPATVPALAVAMTLELARDAVVLVKARTASGFNYTFDAARTEPGQ